MLRKYEEKGAILQVTLKCVPFFKTGKTVTHNPEGQIRGVGVGVLNDLKSLSH